MQEAVCVSQAQYGSRVRTQSVQVTYFSQKAVGDWTTPESEPAYRKLPCREQSSVLVFDKKRRIYCFLFILGGTFVSTAGIFPFPQQLETHDYIHHMNT